MQLVLIVAIYIFLFVREYLLIGCFLCFTAIWTSLITLFSIVSSSLVESEKWDELRSEIKTWCKQGIPPSGSGKILFHRGFLSTPSTLRAILLQWLRLSAYIFWSQTNGGESGGNRRPNLLLWMTPFLQPLLFTITTLLQWSCLFIFGWCPPANLLPTTIQTRLRHAYR